MNADDKAAGGLPELPEPEWRASDGVSPGVYTADQMRAYGAACAALSSPKVAQGEGLVPLRSVLNFIDCLAIDGKGLRHEYIESRSGSMVRVPNFFEEAVHPQQPVDLEQFREAVEDISSRLRNISRIMAGGDGTTSIEAPAWKRVEEHADRLLALIDGEGVRNG